MPMSSVAQGPASGGGAGKTLKRASSSTIQDKFMVGYQGWFTCGGDGKPIGDGHHGWLHWLSEPLAAPFNGRPNTDLWPDTSAYEASELYPIEGLTHKDGKPAQVFSSRDPRTVRRHFRWMAEHGVDGAFLQRFVGQVDSEEAGNRDERFGGTLRLRDEVGRRVREAAEAEGRVWAIMYDVSGVSADKIHRIITQDFTHLLHDERIFDSPAYLHERGRPVVAVWGFGLSDSPVSPDLVRDVFASLRHVYRAFTSPDRDIYIFAGVPSHWRQPGQGDAHPASGWSDVWLGPSGCVDALSPWSVGRYGNIEEVERWAGERWGPDADMVAKHNEGIVDLGKQGRKVDYVPVILPGGSGFNLSEGKWAFNGIKRMGGKFLWSQVFHAKRLKGVRSMYGAMWDEYDEGTAFLPVVPHARQLPEAERWPFLALDEDGFDLPSDWYMRIAGFAAEGLRSERRVHDTFPNKELQDYWGTRPRYEEQVSVDASSSSSSASATSAPTPTPAPLAFPSAAERERQRELAREREREQAAKEAKAQFEAWSEEQARKEKEKEEMPPPAYSLEDDLNPEVEEVHVQGQGRYASPAQQPQPLPPQSQSQSQYASSPPPQQQFPPSQYASPAQSQSQYASPAQSQYASPAQQQQQNVQRPPHSHSVDGLASDFAQTRIGNVAHATSPPPLPARGGSGSGSGSVSPAGYGAAAAGRPGSGPGPVLERPPLHPAHPQAASSGRMGSYGSSGSSGSVPVQQQLPGALRAGSAAGYAGVVGSGSASTDVGGSGGYAGVGAGSRAGAGLGAVGGIGAVGGVGETYSGPGRVASPEAQGQGQGQWNRPQPQGYQQAQHTGGSGGSASSSSIGGGYGGYPGPGQSPQHTGSSSGAYAAPSSPPPNGQYPPQAYRPTSTPQPPYGAPPQPHQQSPQHTGSSSGPGAYASPASPPPSGQYPQSYGPRPTSTPQPPYGAPPQPHQQSPQHTDSSSGPGAYASPSSPPPSGQYPQSYGPRPTSTYPAQIPSSSSQPAYGAPPPAQAPYTPPPPSHSQPPYGDPTYNPGPPRPATAAAIGAGAGVAAGASLGYSASVSARPPPNSSSLRPTGGSLSAGRPNASWSQYPAAERPTTPSYAPPPHAPPPQPSLAPRPESVRPTTPGYAPSPAGSGYPGQYPPPPTHLPSPDLSGHGPSFPGSESYAPSSSQYPHYQNTGSGGYPGQGQAFPQPQGPQYPASPGPFPGAGGGPSFPNADSGPGYPYQEPHAQFPGAGPGYSPEGYAYGQQQQGWGPPPHRPGSQPYPGQPQPYGAGPNFPSPNPSNNNTSGPFGFAISSVDKIVGRRTREQLEGHVDKLADSSVKLFNKFR